MNTQPLLMYSTSAYEYLQADMCRLGGFETGAIVRRWFPDGERYLRLETDCADRDVAVVGGTISESDTLELFDLACGIVKYGARRLTLVIPFFGYSTMERAVKAREIVTAKNRARLFSAIPIAAMGNRVIAVDLHVSAIIHYFEGGIRPVHVYAKPLIAEAARRLGAAARGTNTGTDTGTNTGTNTGTGTGDFVLGCTDAGRAKWVESLANDMGVTPAFVYKRRVDGEHTQVTGVSAHVRDRPVVIYDDMIRTGGSLMGAAHAYRDAGASSISAIATHGLFPGDALARLHASGLFDALVCTDTHPRARQLGAQFRDFLDIMSVADLLLPALRETV